MDSLYVISFGMGLAFLGLLGDYAVCPGVSLLQAEEASSAATKEIRSLQIWSLPLSNPYRRRESLKFDRRLTLVSSK